MVVGNTAVKKVTVKQHVQQIGFSAAADAGYYFDQAVVFPTDQFIQIIVPFNLHIRAPL